MFLGVIGAIAGATAIPMSGVSVAIGASSTAISAASMSQNANQTQQSREQEKQTTSAAGGEPEKIEPTLEKFNLVAECVSESSKKDQVHNKIVVLKDEKVYYQDSLVQASNINLQLYLDDPDNRRFPDGHPFAGFYIEYPFIPSKPQALVSTIKLDPPELNWVFARNDTHVFTYGPKTKSLGHFVGPWSWTEDKRCVTLEDWEGFVVMEEEKDVWVLYYDNGEDHLEGTGIRNGRRVLEVNLVRKMVKPAAAPAAS